MEKEKQKTMDNDTKIYNTYIVKIRYSEKKIIIRKRRMVKEKETNTPETTHKVININLMVRKPRHTKLFEGEVKKLHEKRHKIFFYCFSCSYFFKSLP